MTRHASAAANRLALASALFSISIGATVLFGWLTEIYVLVQLLPHLPYMVKNTAACFVLSGIALLAFLLHWPRWIVSLVAGTVALLCSLTVFEYASGINLGTNTLLGPTKYSVRPRVPGRIAPLAAVCFTMFSVGLLLSPRSLSERSALLLGFNGSIIAALGLAAAIGIGGNATLTALHTAVGLTVLGLGTLSVACQAKTGAIGAPPWLPASVSVGVIASTIGLWQALIDTGQPPFGLLPLIVLFGGCLIAPVFGLTVHLAQRGYAQATALRRSEAFLTEAQRLSLTGSFSWRVESDVVIFSDQTYRIYGFNPTEPVTLDMIATRLHPEDASTVKELIARARALGSDLNFEYRLCMPDGTVKHLHLVAHGSRGRDGELEYIGAIQDVTQRRQSDETLSKVRSELARVARVTSLGALTASIAHEVNQPLSGIITNASTCLRMLGADPPNLEGARETAKRIIRDGNRAADVITRLRMLFANKDATTEPVDLNEAAREVVALSLRELQRNRIVVRTELADDLPSAIGDRVQLQQVMLNLILNASEAMSGVEAHPRELTIRTARDGHDVLFSVRDTGVGLGSDGTSKVFEPFYTTKNGGMGIGLSVSRSIVDNHRGRLWAAPNEGPGALFAFAIPSAQARDAPATSERVLQTSGPEQPEQAMRVA